MARRNLIPLSEQVIIPKREYKELVFSMMDLNDLTAFLIDRYPNVYKEFFDLEHECE